MFHAAGIITRTHVAHIRAMTIGGLCIYLGIAQKTWFEYVKKPEMRKITSNVTEIIRKQKFEGAAADMLNANIIARDLGLVDKKAVEVDEKVPRTPEELEIMKNLSRALVKGLK